MLRTWKTAQEARYNDFLAQAMPNITFVELAAITNVLVNGEQLPPSPITVIPHQDKIDRNRLTGQSILWFNMGLLQTKRVENYVEATGSIDRTFVSRLTSGFINEYQQQRVSTANPSRIRGRRFICRDVPILRPGQDRFPTPKRWTGSLSVSVRTV
jgi:hypothetical protein